MVSQAVSRVVNLQFLAQRASLKVCTRRKTDKIRPEVFVHLIAVYTSSKLLLMLKCCDSLANQTIISVQVCQTAKLSSSGLRPPDWASKRPHRPSRRQPVHDEKEQLSTKIQDRSPLWHSPDAEGEAPRSEPGADQDACWHTVMGERRPWRVDEV